MLETTAGKLHKFTNVFTGGRRRVEDDQSMAESR